MFLVVGCGSGCAWAGGHTDGHTDETAFHGKGKKKRSAWPREWQNTVQRRRRKREVHGRESASTQFPTKLPVKKKEWRVAGDCLQQRRGLAGPQDHEKQEQTEGLKEVVGNKAARAGDVTGDCLQRQQGRDRRLPIKAARGT